MSKDYLIHNGQLLSTDELMHKANFKYIKREWKNGKWQYWYKDTTKKIVNKVKDIAGVDERERYNQAKAKSDKSLDAAKSAVNARNKAADNVYKTNTQVFDKAVAYNKAKAKYDKANFFTKIPAKVDLSIAKKGLDDAKADEQKAKNNLKVLEKQEAKALHINSKDAAETDKAKKAYDKTIVGVYDKVTNKAKEVSEAVKVITQTAVEEYKKDFDMKLYEKDPDVYLIKKGEDELYDNIIKESASTIKKAKAHIKENGLDASTVKDIVQIRVLSGRAKTLKILNNVGDSNLDDKVLENQEKVRKWFDKLVDSVYNDKRSVKSTIIDVPTIR